MTKTTRAAVQAVTLLGGLSLIGVQSALADTVTLDDGSVVDFATNVGGDDATGVVSGTITQGGTTSTFDCVVDAGSGAVSGPAACNDILGGDLTGGLDVNDIGMDIIQDRIEAVADFNTDIGLRLIDNQLDRYLGDLTTRIQARMQAGNGGAAADIGPVGTWGQVSGGFIDDSRAGRLTEGENIVATVGVDYRFDRVIVGMFGGYTRTDLDLMSLNGTYKSDGYVVGGYMAVILSEVFSLEGFGAYSDAGVDFERMVNGQTVTAEFDESGWSGGIALNGYWRLGTFGLQGTAGVVHADWKTDSYVDSLGVAYNPTKGNRTLLKLGTKVTLHTANGYLEPYVLATYLHQLSDPVRDSDRGALVLGGGLNLVNTPGWTVSAEGTAVLLKDQQEAYTAGLRVRLHL